MNDDLARSADPYKQIQRIRTEIQTADNREQLHLLANELRKALWRMDDLERELYVDDLNSLIPLFFQF